MGKKIHPNLVRTPVKEEANWFSRHREIYKQNFLEDITIRNCLQKYFGDGVLSKACIKRASAKKIDLTIRTDKAGKVVGKQGATINDLKLKIAKQVSISRIKNGITKPVEIEYSISNLHRPELDAKLIGENICKKIQDREDYRRVIKNCMRNTMRSGAKGILIKISGRLNGANISRSMRQTLGSIPRQTFKSQIDYHLCHIRTTYGVIGLKTYVHF